MVLNKLAIATSSSVLYPANSEHGLVSNQVHQLAQDGLGRIWMAGPAGLACFDGNSVRSFDQRDGLQCQGLRALAIDERRTIWVGTDLGLEVLDATGRPQPWMQAQAPWTYGLCEHIEAVDDVVWIGTAQGIVCLSAADATPGVAYHADIGFVHDFACVSATQLFVASKTQGLVEVNGGSWKRLRAAALVDRDIVRIALGPNNVLLLGTDDGVLVFDVTYKQVREQRYGSSDTHQVTALAYDGTRCWAAFGHDVLAFSLSGETSSPSEHFRFHGRVNDLLVDALGNVWVATDTAGLAMVSCLRRAIARIELDRANAVYAIKPLADDTYAIGGNHYYGRLRYAADALSLTPEPTPGLPHTTIWDSNEDASGVWLATHAGLFHAPPGAPFVRAFAALEVLGAPARVLVRRGKALWVGTLRGLACIENGVAREIRPADGLALGYVYCLHLDADNHLWIGTLGRGLWRERDGLTAIVAAPLSSAGNTYAAISGPGGVLVLQDEQVILLDAAGAGQLVQSHHPVAGWTALWLDANTIAIGASDGLRIVQLKAGETQMTVSALYPIPDWEFTNNRTLVQDAAGCLLCGVNGGLLRVDLRALQAFSEPPIPHLTDVQWSGAIPEKTSEGYRLPPGRWSMRVRAFAAWFVDPSQVRFRFKLVGFHDEWLALQSAPEITYTSLPPGHYSLQIQCYSPLSGFGPIETLLNLDVQRPWWAAGWSTGLNALEAFYDRMVRSGARNGLLRARNEALEKEVAERTAYLRASNAALQAARSELERTSRTDSLTESANRRYFDGYWEREVERARRQRQPLSLLLLDVDFFKAINDEYGHQVGDDFLRVIAAALRQQVRGAVDLVARYGGEEFAIVSVGTRFDQAQQLAERIRLAMAGVHIVDPLLAHKRVTVSIGFVSLEGVVQASASELIGLADRALYEAKHQGRNRVVGVRHGNVPDVDLTG
jgi:diguanylate cyclase (GGDEF)-like protein